MGSHHGLLLLRSFFGIIAITLFFVTIQRMPLGASVSLKYTAPVFTAIFAILFLRERVRAIEWLLFLLALGGVLLMKGFDARISMIDLTLGLLGAVASGLVYVMIRKIGNREHPLVIVNYFMFISSVMAGIAMIPFWQTPSPREAVLLITMGTLGIFAQVYLTKAFQQEEASKMVPFKYLEVVFSLLIGLVVFGEGYAFLSIVGMGIIVGSLTLRFFVKGLAVQRAGERHK